MKTQIFLLIMAFGLFISALSQNTIELTFTASNSSEYVQLDSIKVMNRTQGGETMIYWPDTTITIEFTQGDLLLYIGYTTVSTIGVQEIQPKMEEFTLSQNYPNPVKEQSMVSLYIPEKGELNILVSDIQGRTFFNDYWKLDKGHHSFRFTPGQGNIFFLTANWKGLIRSIKILNINDYSGKASLIEYSGTVNGKSQMKVSSFNEDIMQESGILDNPEMNETYTFQFAINIPCPGTPTVEYDGQNYNTIQIFSQCWLKENLNVGTMIPGDLNMTNNDTIEKYCFNNEPDSCMKYGGLYQWWEMMQYTTQQGVQGICPSGWHLPTDEEWKVLEGAVDSQSGIGDLVWNDWGTNGYDAGTNLKTTSGWHESGNGTDLLGYSGLPGGDFDIFLDSFFGIGYYGLWWTSTQDDYVDAVGRTLYYEGEEVIRYNISKESGHSVRCLRNE